MCDRTISPQHLFTGSNVTVKNLNQDYLQRDIHIYHHIPYNAITWQWKRKVKEGNNNRRTYNKKRENLNIEIAS